MRKVIFFVGMMASTTLVLGADRPFPSASSMEQEKDRIEKQRQILFDPQNPAVQAGPRSLPAGAPLENEMQRIERERKAIFDPNNPALQNTKNSFPNVPTPAASQTDVQALAKRYEGRAEARKADDLMVFVSFTMPIESLKRAVAEANKVGAAIILNGFKQNSMKATAMAIKALGEVSGNVLVNPNAFVQYKIKAVPAVVLAKADGMGQLDGQGCALPENYVSVAGDVSLAYALSEIAQRAPQFSGLAQRYARQLKGRL